MAFSGYPKCAAYLRGAKVDPNDPTLTEFWAAVIIADAAFKEDELEAANIGFGDGPVLQRDGAAILAKLEGLLGTRRLRQKAPQIDMESLKAFFGSRGVKASKLRTDEDFWGLALLMWPALHRKPSYGLSDLHRQLRGMTKRQRRSAKVETIPAHLRAGSAA